MTDGLPPEGPDVRAASAAHETAMWQELRDKIAAQERHIRRLYWIIGIILFAVFVFHPSKPNDPNESGVSHYDPR